VDEGNVMGLSKRKIKIRLLSCVGSKLLTATDATAVRNARYGLLPNWERAQVSKAASLQTPRFAKSILDVSLPEESAPLFGKM
jgi:hypothetical protein